MSNRFSLIGIKIIHTHELENVKKSPAVKIPRAGPDISEWNIKTICRTISPIFATARAKPIVSSPTSNTEIKYSE